MSDMQSAVRRPRRADAARNFDALLAAAREAFARDGTEASLEDIARQAGVGIGTLYRNFPTRQDLFEAVYVEEINQLNHAAQTAAAQLPPWDALVSWARRFMDYAVTKRAIIEALNRESGMFRACRASMYAAGEPLMDGAHRAGVVRAEASFDDVVRMLAGLTGGSYLDDAQRDRILGYALDGLRP